MQKSGKLELTWVGKYDTKVIEPRIFVEDFEKSYGDPNSQNMPKTKAMCLLPNIFAARFLLLMNSILSSDPSWDEAVAVQLPGILLSRENVLNCPLTLFRNMNSQGLVLL